MVHENIIFKNTIYVKSNTAQWQEFDAIEKEYRCKYYLSENQPSKNLMPLKKNIDVSII